MRATHRQGDRWKRYCEIFLIEFNPTYVVAKFKLATCVVEKVGQGQRLCNCVNIQIFEGYPGAGGTDGKGVVTFF